MGCAPGSGREGPLQRCERSLGAPDGMGIMSERDHGTGMDGELGHESNLDALGLARGDEAVPSLLGDDWQADALRVLPIPGHGASGAHPQISPLALSTLSMLQTPNAQIYHRLWDGSPVCQQ